MKTKEEIKNKVYDKIRDDLKGSRMEGYNTDDGDKYPLLDYLSKGTTIKEGLSEADNIVEQIDIDDLLQEFAEAYHQEKDKVKTKEEGFCACGNPSKTGNVHFEGDEKLIYKCDDCEKEYKSK